MAISPQFDLAWDFAEGLAAVNIGTERGIYGRLNRDMRDRCHSVTGGKWGYWGYIDRTGKMVISLQFACAGHFSEGLAVIEVGGEPGSGKWGYIDRTGKIVISPQFDEAHQFSEGLAVVAVTRGNNAKGYIDRTGRIVISPQFDIARDFSQGLARVAVFRESMWGIPHLNWTQGGYIDRTGKYVWRPGLW